MDIDIFSFLTVEQQLSHLNVMPVSFSALATVLTHHFRQWQHTAWWDTDGLQCYHHWPDGH